MLTFIQIVVKRKSTYSFLIQTEGGYGGSFLTSFAGIAEVLHIQHSFGPKRDNRVDETTARIGNRFGIARTIRSHCLAIGTHFSALCRTRNLCFRYAQVRREMRRICKQNAYFCTCEITVFNIINIFSRAKLWKQPDSENFSLFSCVWFVYSSLLKQGSTIIAITGMRSCVFK